MDRQEDKKRVSDVQNEDVEMAQSEETIRTDLALEVRESFPGDGGEVPGVALEEREAAPGIRVTRVVIFNEEGAEAMGKPIGSYITLEAPELAESAREQRKAMNVLAAELVGVLEGLDWAGETRSVLVVGLGNSDMTADALGPQVLAELAITRNMGLEGSAYLVSSIAPGVMGQTGMETAEILRGIVAQTGPDCVIVIDALAARSVTRLGTTIQLTDTGIQPGSGVGNYRNCLSKETLGVPVIAIGVPTVVSAATIVYDMTGTVVETLHPMFVTPKNIDEIVKWLSGVIAAALNRTFIGHNGAAPA